ncbi:hypothetical protein ACU686_01485 [Yinghuangia aomiensis]
MTRQPLHADRVPVVAAGPVRPPRPRARRDVDAGGRAGPGRPGARGHGRRRVRRRRRPADQHVASCTSTRTRPSCTGSPPSSSRAGLGNNAHVLLGTRTALTPHVALALDGWAWRNGQPPLGEVPPGHRLARVPSAVLDETLAERARSRCATPPARGPTSWRSCWPRCCAAPRWGSRCGSRTPAGIRWRCCGGCSTW